MSGQPNRPPNGPDGAFPDGFLWGGATAANQIADGVQVLGYTSWGCIDLVSFTTAEASKRYGYIYVDRNDEGTGTLARYRKTSFDWYRGVIASNGATLRRR